MSRSEIKNILVLGTCGVPISQFVELFGTYLKYDSYEEAMRWLANSANNKSVSDIARSIMLIGDNKFNFIYTPNYLDNTVHTHSHTHFSQKNLPILLYFIQQQSITGIVFVVKPDMKEHASKYKRWLLSKLKQFADKNILYVFALNKDSYNYEAFMEGTFRQERNKFYFQEDMFYTISKDNWQQCVEFCKDVCSYITGNESIDALQDFYIQSVIPQESVLSLGNNLYELLINIYICAEYSNLTTFNNGNFEIYINVCKTNVTTCYGNNCIEWRTMQGNEKFKIPKICHGPCNCTESNVDVKKCVMLQTSDATCLQCKCKNVSHLKKYFNYSGIGTTSKNNKLIAIKILAMFFLYKKQEECNFENIILQYLDIQDPKHETILKNFKKELSEEIQKTTNPITSENILTCLKQLYGLIDRGKIIPFFIEEIFPEDFQLEVITDEQNVPNKEIEKTRTEKPKGVIEKNEITEIKQMVQQLLSLNKSNLMRQQAADLLSKLNQEGEASTKRRKFEEKENEEKEVVDEETEGKQ